MRISMKRKDIIGKFWDIGAKYIILTTENNDYPIYYGDIPLCYTERRIIMLIGENPEITVTEMAARIRKTVSICSQTVRKFANLGWVEQTRNLQNKRIYNLTLTDEGAKVFGTCSKRYSNEKKAIINSLEKFSDEELEIYTRIQEAINEVGEELNAAYRT